MQKQELFSTLIADWQVGLFDCSDLKIYLQMRGLGPDVISLVRPTGV